MKKIYFFLCLLFLPFSVSAQQYDITNYYIDVTVNKNNIYSITEYYNLSFIEKSIFTRTIQLRPRVYLPSGKFISYVAKVTDVQTAETITEQEKSKTYKITFPESPASTSKSVSISYQYNMGNDLDGNHDVVFVNLSDGTIETVAGKSTFSVMLPRSVEQKDVHFYKNGKKLDGAKITYNVSSNYIDGTINEKIDKGDIISIQIVLPENTFKNIVRTDNSTSYFLIIIPVIVLALGCLTFKKYKKEKHNIADNPFAIKKMFDSIEMSYLYKGETNVIDLLSLIFKLANDGYISLRNYGSKDNISFKIKKEKEYDKDNAAQKILFDGLFQNREEVDVHDIEGVFYPYYVDAKRTLQNKRNKEKLFYPSVDKIKILILVGIYIGFVLLQIKPLYHFFDSHVFGIIGGIIASAVIVATAISKNKIVQYVLLALSAVIIAIEGYALIDFRLDFCMYLIGILISGISLFVISLVPLRTIYGEQMYYEVDMFKKELAIMSDETFDEKTNENPNYFFEMIPYVIVFDLTSWWFNRFGSKVEIAPNWYQSSEAYTNEKLFAFIEEVINQLAVPVQMNRMYMDELLHQAQNKLL